MMYRVRIIEPEPDLEHDAFLQDLIDLIQAGKLIAVLRPDGQIGYEVAHPELLNEPVEEVVQ
jgi:hypothetical protein